MKLRDERGVTAIIVSVGMLLFLGMAALAIDIGFGFNERRQDQTSADTGVMAGAVEALNGGISVRAQTLQYVRLNLPTVYTDPEWQALWEGCTDPDRNDGGFNFVALAPPPGWTVADPANWCISMESARGLLRVQVPQQVIDTTFGAVLGVSELRTSASAVSRIGSAGEGGILPFGLPFGSGDGGLLCLSSAPTGQAVDPCSGPSAGNFGTLKGRKFGNPDIPTSQNCNASPLGQVLAQNIAHGYDHLVVPDPDGLVSNEVRDQCFNPFVDTLNTDTGFPNNGVAQGLVGPVPGGYTPLLAKSTNTTTVFGRTVDDTPFWSFLLFSGPDYGGGGTAAIADDAPASCDPSSFDISNPLFDWDNNGVDDTPNSWQHMQVCIDEYVAGPFSVTMFGSAIGDNEARFGYVPEFWEASLGNGNSWLHILRFRAIYIQTATWKSGGNFVFHSPGELCRDGDGVAVPQCSVGNFSIRQVTTFVIPDSALPAELQGVAPPGGQGLNPFTTELFG